MDYDEPTDDAVYRYYQRGMDALDNGDTDSAEYCLQTAVEMGNGKAALALYDAYRTNTIEPPNRSTAKHYLYQAADLGNATAEYIHGKSGGGRVIYLDVLEREHLYLLFAYPKNVQSDLTADQKKAIRHLVEQIKKE